MIAQIHSITTAIEAIASQISGMHNNKNHAIRVRIESIKRSFL
jgi:hypothetical protein